ACSGDSWPVNSLVAPHYESNSPGRPFAVVWRYGGKYHARNYHTRNQRMGASPRFSWFILALLNLHNVVNFLDRPPVVSLQVPLKADPYLQLADLRISLLAGYAFAVVYSVAGLVLGTIADRWNRPRLIAIGLLIWSAMTAASGL